MEDTPAAGAWPERENQNAARVAEIVDYVKQENDLLFEWTRTIPRRKLYKSKTYQDKFVTYDLELTDYEIRF